ncbi:T9SS type A sorting domain-containing protein [candidate division GN15 bacterium]|nr:T9SS type A sorting domain-containing protein [candidate division GN15 bacterium]
MFASLGRSGVLILIVLSFVAGLGMAADDPYGEPDLVYLDPVEGRAGEQVAVRVNFRNDEVLGSISVPLTYDTDLLTLSDISFEGSRAEHIETRFIAPEKVSDINGHFVVAVVRFSEDPIPEGDGLFFTAVFDINPDAPAGTETVVDSLFYPPGSELLLIENSVAGQIRPDFEPGVVTIKMANQAPSFVGLSDQYLLEGESLSLDVAISDPNLDAVRLAATTKPTGATFVDHGDGSGTFTWTPGYVGPYSADGSPYTVVFWAGDGQFSVEQQIELSVVNVNRPPVIDAPAEVVVEAGESMSFDLSATDPDFEDITWTVLSGQPGYTFDHNNPAQYTWQAAITDTTTDTVRFIAQDPGAAADTAAVAVRVRPATLYTLAIDTISADLGAAITVPITLENLVPVSGFDVLFGYDVTAATITDVTSAGTRAESFAYFTVTYDANTIPGNVRVVGIADPDTPGGSPLAAGEGPIALLSFDVTSDLAFSGLAAPLQFKQLNSMTATDNTLLDTLGQRIDTTQIYRADGLITINSIGTVRTGDINLNGIANEIGDVIYFTNHLIDPSLYPFTAIQYANSDINGDNIVASIADLVGLINIIISGDISPKSLGGPDPVASMEPRSEFGRRVIEYESNVDIAAALVTFEAHEGFEVETIRTDFHEMTVAAHRTGSTVRVLFYSLEGETLPAGRHELFALENAENITLVAAEMGTVDGRQSSLSLISDEPILPEEVALHQNYPNPFNPETRIAFELPVSGRVRLSVYNVLGQEVTTLIDSDLGAGRHEVSWRGTDRSGQAVSSGIYLYRLETQAQVLTRKMMLLK